MKFTKVAALYQMVLLNKQLEPNKKYKIGKNIYETDGSGRVSGVKGELDLKTAERNNYQQ